MKVLYRILATSGWVWLAVAFALVWLRLRYLRSRRKATGFDVNADHDQQHRPNGSSPT